MALETPQTTLHPVDPPDPVILSKSPGSSSSVSPIVSPAEFALLLDSQALGESILKRHLADLNSRPEPPTTEAVTCAILSLRRTTNNRRMLMLMINPDAFRRTPRTNPDDTSPHETPRAWRHTKTAYPDPYSSSDPVDPLDPVILSKKSPSDFSNSSFAIRNSPPPIAVHANPHLLNPNADDDYDPNDDLELDADLTSDLSDAVNPSSIGVLEGLGQSSASTYGKPNPSADGSRRDHIISSHGWSDAKQSETRGKATNIPALKGPHNLASSGKTFENGSDPEILSKNSSSAVSASLRENSSSSSSRSLFGLSPEASKTLAAILEPLRNAPRQLRPVPEKYEGMTIEEYNAYVDFNDSGRPMDYLKPEIVAQNKRYTDYIYRDRSLDPKPESPNPANPSPDPEILSKSSSSADSAPLRENSPSASSFSNSTFAIRNSPAARSRAGPS